MSSTVSYKSNGKTIKITYDFSSAIVSVSGFDGSTSYPRDFYITYKRSTLSSSSYKDFGSGGFTLAANELPPDPWEEEQTDLASETTYSLHITVWNTKKIEKVWEWEETEAFTTETTPVVTPTPTINSIDTSRGISDVRIYWDVDKHVRGTTYTIYVKQSGGSWVAKKTLTSVPSSRYTSINVNKSNTLYYVYIQANLDGDTVDSNTKNFKVVLTAPSAWIWTTAELNAFNNKRAMLYNHKNSLE